MDRRVSEPPRARARLALLLVFSTALACEEAGDSAADVEADIALLHEVVQDDPAIEALAEIDRIADDRPVHAAEALRDRAIPAAREQVQAASRAEVRTARGRVFARRLGRAYRARVEALESYREVLAYGPSADPVELLDATRSRREAEEMLLTTVDEMSGAPGAE